MPIPPTPPPRALPPVITKAQQIRVLETLARIRFQIPEGHPPNPVECETIKDGISILRSMLLMRPVNPSSKVNPDATG